jgi:hypothetical protein
MRQAITKNEKKNTAGDARFNVKISSNTREKNHGDQPAKLH